MLRTDTGQTIRLEDYRPTDFVVHDVEMVFRLREEGTEALTVTEFERRAGIAADVPLRLDGDELSITSVKLDGTDLEADRYKASPDALTVYGLPASGRFRLAVATVLDPIRNTKLMGLYRSNGIWCTQCEAEGFRRITYFYDRPDVLAIYRVRVEASLDDAPVLLSNGNLVESGALDGGRHFAVWHDPFPKPSYLFALVAGKLDLLADDFRTAGGRAVRLGIYTEPGQAQRAGYAMDAVKRSMRWDERRFDREYDLDVFNVVAISDFNMGAMENKGLNVFNHKYVLLDPETATDSDYQGVETVIAHEYFHNWTGNRITCRDWFQLCLKEGLTVYRDQEFTADERSAPVKRIAAVRGLKAHQFPEDQGPLQHPVRPREYREISNFYTSTIYDKGAEIVRMIETILGRAAFRAGMDRYFDRHDGDAATIEDFIRCFEDASGRDLAQFSRWYTQAGTPELRVDERYDADAGRLTLRLGQSLAPGAAGTPTLPFHMPVRFALVGSDGRDLDARPVADGHVEGDVIHLREAQAEIVFEGLGEKPFVSVLRDFSAPVILRFEQPVADRLALARLDRNPFNRWRALSDLIGETLKTATARARDGAPITPDAAVCDAMIASAADAALDPALRAQMLTLPSEADIARLIGDNVDPLAIHRARRDVIAQIGRRGQTQFATLRRETGRSVRFSPDAGAAGRRAFAGVLLEYVVAADDRPGAASEQYDRSGNMTERLAALTLLAHRFPGEADTKRALDDFYARFETDPLVIDKWFAIQASVPQEETLDTVRTLASHPQFRLSNPNRARALIGTFAAGNQVGFNRADGEGYWFVAEMLQSLDTLNPQIAARIATAFRSWRCFEAGRREHGRNTLAQLAEIPELSRDLRDIVERSLR